MTKTENMIGGLCTVMTVIFYGKVTRRAGQGTFTMLEVKETPIQAHIFHEVLCLIW